LFINDGELTNGVVMNRFLKLANENLGDFTSFSGYKRIG